MMYVQSLILEDCFHIHRLTGESFSPLPFNLSFKHTSMILVQYPTLDALWKCETSNVFKLCVGEIFVGYH